jgi:hypothetical protein
MAIEIDFVIIRIEIASLMNSGTVGAIADSKLGS